MSKTLTHFDKDGRVNMVDVSEKNYTQRISNASRKNFSKSLNVLELITHQLQQKKIISNR
jgi:molybdenum cofactor biosynthesis enzyme